MHGLAKWLMKRTSRDTTTGFFIPEIDGLRFIAISSVILFHITWYLSQKAGKDYKHDPLAMLLIHGDIGVPLFFVISGFVIALPFAKGYLTADKLPKLRYYFSRRLTRLEPPYIANLLIVCALIPLVTTEKLIDLLPHLLASMGYLHNITYGKASAINIVAWSLEVELQFYILAPLITGVFRIPSKTGRRSLLLVAIIFFSFLSFLTKGSLRCKLSILCQAQFFLTGLLLVDVYITEWRQNHIKSLRWDVISLVSWGLVIALLFPKQRMGEYFLVAPVFFAYCGAFKGVWSNRFFTSPLIYTIGGMCYTIYLYHFQIISAFGRLLFRTEVFYDLPLWLSIMISSLVLVPVILISCTLLFIFIEKPFMKKEWHVMLLERFRATAKTSE
jgi:peptidoglycan/LPS O-acetylase OafA/YrhL